VARPVEDLVEGLETQRSAAHSLRQLAQRILTRVDRPQSILLIGPSGTGKTRALQMLFDVLHPVGVVAFDLAELRNAADLATEIADLPRGGVLLLDGLERLTARAGAMGELVELLFPTAAACGEETTIASATVVAAVTVDGVELADDEPLEVQLDGLNRAVRQDAANLLPLAAERGVSAELLARFEVFVPFQSLDEVKLDRLLDSLDDDFLGERFGRDFRVELGPELRQLVVQRALRVGGGAWGLKAVFAAMMSGFRPDLDEATRPPTLVRAL